MQRTGVYFSCMILYLLRHGVAVNRGTPGFEDDSARPLTAEGRRKLRNICVAMRKLKLRPCLILSSPLVRARQSAEIVAEALECTNPVRISENLRPGGSPEKLASEVSALRPAPKSLLLAGHEPDLGGLVSLLATGRAGHGFALKKGGLAKLKIEREFSANQCAKLVWLITPGQLRRMI